MRRGVTLGLFALALLTARGAAAHTSSVTYAQLSIDADQVRYQLKIASGDLYEALGLDKDRPATRDETLAGRTALERYLLAKLALSRRGDVCTPTPRALTMEDSVDGFYAVMAIDFACPAPVDQLALRYDLFFDLDPRHEGRARVEWRQRHEKGPKRMDAWFREGQREFTWERSATRDQASGAVKTTLDNIWQGVDHILTGYDHICFLVLLLVVALLARRRDPDGRWGAWHTRDVKSAAKHVVAIVTAFTVGHTITLILAALDVIVLPTRLVESAIAASIMFVAVENMVIGESRMRWPLTFGFGLVHGLGFAKVVSEELPAEGKIVALLLRNVGVELGQLAIVAGALPLLYLFARMAGRPYRIFVNVVSGGVLAVATIWFIQRVFDTKLLGGAVGG